MNPVTPMHPEWQQNEFTVSTDPARLDVAAIHRFLTTSYWATGIPYEVVARSLQHSLCFGVYHGREQIGLARIITDRATFAYLCDVYILEAWRGRGLAKWLMACVGEHPDLQGLRRFNLVTRDAHPLYRQFGFVTPARPEGYMEKLDRDVYKRAAAP
jgi:GNAT superfamily N-acetyltransferase